MNQTFPTRNLSVSASVRLAETQDGAVLLDVQQGLCFSLNPVGTLIWKRLCDGCSVTQIVQSIAEACSISEEQARNDTDEFLQALIGKRLVQTLDHKEPDNDRHGWFTQTFPWLWKLISAGRARQPE